ncbi:MAG: hypothetical protein ACSHXB_02815 [Sulfitobacter sp.]
MNHSDKQSEASVKKSPRIVPLGQIETLTGHDNHGNRADGSTTTSNRKDPGRGTNE